MSSFLLDTHALLWWLAGNTKLPLHLRTLIYNPDNEIYVSVIGLWEIATKVSVGKPDESAGMMRQITRNEFTILPVEKQHVEFYKTLPLHHRDPFDRMLIAQSLAEDLPLISNEAVFDAYAVKRIW